MCVTSQLIVSNSKFRKVMIIIKIIKTKQRQFYVQGDNIYQIPTMLRCR